MKGINLVFIFIVFLFSSINSKAIVTGHYVTDGVSCYAAKALIGERTQVCKCNPASGVAVFGGIATSISECSPDSISIEELQFAKIDEKLKDNAKTFLNNYRIYLISQDKPNTNKLADAIKNFLESVTNRDFAGSKQSEIDYVRTLDSLSKEEKDKVENWIKVNSFQ